MTLTKKRLKELYWEKKNLKIHNNCKKLKKKQWLRRMLRDKVRESEIKGWGHQDS
jgi:hypothetical protein